MAVNLEGAVHKVQNYFIKQCGNMPQAYWEVIESTEDISKDVYVIKCKEKCCLDGGNIREHVVWVSRKTGEILHTHRTNS
jgi:hypothetical protein